MNMKRLLVACGNGIATSTVVATKIREKCEENGVPVMVNQCKLMEVDSKADDYDLLVIHRRDSQYSGYHGYLTADGNR